ncbi:hypothetical protein ACGFNP_25700 [Nonomuraea sp. NPDC049269]|uniref:hypothetical protein n=1 Tax=Nonomuraea sp. NPDC049269 TaxID=3364349 RepID=UPI00371BD036
MSRTTSSAHNHDDGNGNEAETPHSLINNAVRLSKTTWRDRANMRALLNCVDHIAEQLDDPAAPPRNFVEGLRRPARARRRTVRVVIDGKTVPVMLVPQGKADPQREAYLWGYICNLVREGTA